MGLCTSCSSKGMLESEINNFFDGMKLRKTSHEDIVVIVKGKWKGGLNLEAWTYLVNTILSRNLDGSENESYRQFWLDIYGQADIKFLILSILFLCEKHTVSMKQKFDSLTTTVFKQKDQYIKSSDGLKTYVKKDFLKTVMIEYINLISTKTINTATPFKNDTSTGKLNLVEVYKPKIIEDFSQSIIEELDGVLKDKKIRIEHDGYTDFDEFFDITYSVLLHDDKEVRNRLDEYGVAKINSEHNKKK
jgi:hypothetical protein